MNSTRPITSHVTETQPWGWSTAIDLYECDPELIRSREAITEYVARLVKLLEMKAFGETQIVHFGADEKVTGFSMTQLIETSLISGHFANNTNAAYLDVFSCKAYDADAAAAFSAEFFKAKSYNQQVLTRQ
ncbi:MAG: S-adenosylmethionine decarboxylase [Candidatus Lambdaproteobacteria bacterium RIFOXYD12_FULL_49_8]|uniref:S-adenosylmethionine decarboxylase n=1 Tax=Candidatus Lambdaproteobacteria bacterium RIFOXYD2_FULL_50_16 TaxID=1817772 RepID=A0A1F6GAN3_9PROT|nr:MAG: S-adenosylmethionine decarboxylase [Candidatus Lambdaproteobacteria bacterium RIFOXYD2_FULL_50_16]OGG97939.1 MAG: S-adenosylmethionine decarboxylase [Candidatus Lambdaproteobacteria bacterium RIFOXYD12_FULL_49_8]